MTNTFARMLLLFCLVCSWQTNAFSADNNFNASAVYLFNVVSETDAIDLDFDEGNGLAGYIAYRPLSYLMLEVGTVNFDSIKGFEQSPSVTQRTEFQVSGYTVGIKAEGSFNGLFNIWGSVGTYKWDSTFNYSITYPNFPALERFGSNSNSGSDVFYRVGVNAPLIKNINFTVEVAHFEFNDLFSNASSGQNVSFDQNFIGFGFETNFW